jgi:iron complex transport system substrate-binding protein
MLLASGLLACNDARGAVRAETPAAGMAVVEPNLRWAKTVEWSRRAGVVTLTVTEPWKGARTPLRYALLDDRDNLAGAPKKKEQKDAVSPEPRGSAKASSPQTSGVPEIRLPARRIACLAAVHTGFLAALGATNRIVAVDAKRHVHDASVRAGVEAGAIVEVGSGSTVNAERLLAAKPDLVLANAVEATENAALDRLRRAGVPVIVTSEWMENHPLARAEWLRLIGLLIGEAPRADSLFAAVESSYLATAKSSREQRQKPVVLLGGPFRDQWFVSGGRSYMARLIGDAGGLYPWDADTTAGGVPLSFEAVLVRARGADVWLNPGDWRSVGEGNRQDARFGGFTAFRHGDVYNNDARRRADGANDYWESGVSRPDRVLSDLASIFHGSEDSLYYYRRLPP